MQTPCLRMYFDILNHIFALISMKVITEDTQCKKLSQSDNSSNQWDKLSRKMLFQKQ